MTRKNRDYFDFDFHPAIVNQAKIKILVNWTAEQIWIDKRIPYCEFRIVGRRTYLYSGACWYHRRLIELKFNQQRCVKFPCVSTHKKIMQVTMFNWSEVVISLVAHELWHLYSHLNKIRQSEVNCEAVARSILKVFRSLPPDTIKRMAI